ncbi:MAG TPA: hypothetical protein VLA20_06710 [Vicinamibacterales bacterium]|nr:hypothetical protein [Vicinamibacterales bacterium]
MKKVLSCAVLCLLVSIVAAAQQSNPARAHMGHVLDAMNGTPDGAGLLPTAMAEAAIAEQHAGLAAKMSGDLDAMKRHAGHVLHAVDPSAEAQGPGKGYGVKKAAAGIGTHIGLAAASEGASDNVKMHATHVAGAAESVVKRCDEIAALVSQIRAAASAADAAPLATKLHDLARQLTAGADANGDGRIGWQAPEGGLAQAQQHMGFMAAGEGGLR